MSVELLKTAARAARQLPSRSLRAPQGLLQKWLRIDRTDSNGLSAALRRCRARLGAPIRTILDVGASNGCWSLSAKQVFPEARCLLFEAQPVHREALQGLASTHFDMQYVLAAAGDRIGEIAFDASDPLGGVAAHERGDVGNWIRVPMTTVDAEVQRHRVDGPFLLKLDTHGFEVPIFEGAARALADTELIVVETYNFQLNPRALRFHELCAYLEPKGFRCVDLIDPLRRPRDQALWQVDLVFVPIRRLPLDVASAGGYS